MIGRIVWFVALGIIAVVCVGVQLDRQTERVPELSSSVPEFARSSAQLPVTAYAIESGNAQLGLEEAQRLVQRRPMPAEHLRVLALAQFAAGEVEQGGLTIQYAAQRGWRDPLAQEAMLQLALDAGDEAEAARRYTALLVRGATPNDLLEELGSQVLAQPGGEGRQVLAVIVAGADRWHRQFLQRGASVLPADAYVEIVASAMEEGVTFECNFLSPAQRTLGARDAEAAQTFAALLETKC